MSAPIRIAHLPLAACTLLACGSLKQAPEDRGGTGFVFPEQDSNTEPAPGVQVTLGPDGLRVDPGATGELVIEVSPPGEYEVTLAIVGDANGAFLDRDHVRTDADGVAHSRLTVRFEANQLGVLASVEGHSAQLDVRVGPALATVDVKPVYSGQRAIDEWVVNVLSDGSPCPDSTKYEAAGWTFPLDQPIVFEDVPATSPVQVFVRGRGYASGCVADVSLLPGNPNSVVVPVTNRPIQFAGLDMSFQLSFDRTTQLDGTLSTITSGMVTAFRSELATDTEALMAAMGEIYALRAPSYGRSKFDEEAASWGWSQLLQTHLVAQAGAGNPLSDSIESWLIGGYAALWAPNGFVLGTLKTNDSNGTSSLQLDRLGPVTPKALGMDSRVAVLFNAGADDSITAGFSLALRPSQLLGQLAAASPALQDTADVVQALRGLVDCVGLAEELVVQSDDPELPLPKCGLSCLGQLCDDGLSYMWAQAVQTQSAATPLEVTATSAAESEIDDQARPLSFQGTWAGTMDLFADAEAVHLGGPFRAETEQP
jgi:hypothetical protein